MEFLLIIYKTDDLLGLYLDSFISDVILYGVAAWLRCSLHYNDCNKEATSHVVDRALSLFGNTHWADSLSMMS